MTCPFCGGSTALCSVSTAFEPPNAAVAWVCQRCGKAERPEPRRISDEVWEQLRERSYRLTIERHASEKETPSEPPPPMCRNKHLRSEYGRLITRPDGRSYWSCIRCMKNIRETPEYRQRQSEAKKRYWLKQCVKSLDSAAAGVLT